MPSVLFLETGPLTEFSDGARLAGIQQTTNSALPHTHLHLDYRLILPHLLQAHTVTLGFLLGSNDPNSGPLACVVKTLCFHERAEGLTTFLAQLREAVELKDGCSPGVGWEGEAVERPQGAAGSSHAPPFSLVRVFSAFSSSKEENYCPGLPRPGSHMTSRETGPDSP